MLLASEEEGMGKDAITQVESPPRKIFTAVDVLDLSSGGTKAVQSALEEYDLQMDAMEEKLARLLRDKLTACQVCSLSHNLTIRHGSGPNCFFLVSNIKRTIW